MVLTLLVAVAGAVGAVTRFVVDSAVRTRWKTAFPWATVAINVTGSFLLGALTAAVVSHSSPDAVRAVLGTGFCGGYTTFSTAGFETVRLAQQGLYGRAAANAIGTVVLTVAAAAAGFALVPT
jgi:CrcB protein